MNKRPRKSRIAATSAGTPRVAATDGKSPPRIDWWLVAVILLPILYFLPELLGQNVFAGIDTSRLNMPLRYFDRETFRQGALPLWNPYIFAGFPQLAESESGVFYPGNIFIHMPGDFFHWYSVEVVFHFIIAGVGFYTWMRLRGHEKSTSAFLAMTYTVTPFLIFHITAFGLFTSIVWLPWYFVIFELGLKGDKPWQTGLWFALFLGFMLMSGSVQAAFLGISGIILYGIGMLIVAKDSKERSALFVKMLKILVPCILAPMIAAIQLLPTYELSKFSERASTTTLDFYNLGTWLTFPRLVSLFVFPALDNPADIQDYGSSLCYLGIVPFLLIVMTLYYFPEKRRILIPFVIAGVVALLLGFGRNLPGYDFLVSFPPFSLFRYPGRFAHVALTLFLPLAAPSIDWLIMNAKELRKWALPVIGLVLVGSLAIQILLTYPFSRFLVQERGQFDKSLLFFDEIKADFPTDREIPRVLMAGSHELLDPDALSKLGFKAQTEIWDNMAGNASGLRDVTAVNGLTPLNQNDWKLIMRDTIQSRMDTVIQKSEAEGTPKVADDICVKLFRILGVDVLLVQGDDWTIDGYELWKTDLELPYHKGLCAYRAVDGFMPDACVISSDSMLDADNYPEFLRQLANVDIDYLQPTGEILDRERNPNELRFRVNVDSENSLLITGENYFPDQWVTLRDNMRCPNQRANFLLTGIKIDKPGEHDIIMAYGRRSVNSGMKISFFGWIALILGLVFTGAFYRPKRN